MQLSQVRQEQMPSHRGQRASCCPVWYLSLQITRAVSGSRWQMSELKLKRVGATLRPHSLLVTESSVSLGLSLGEDF